MKSRPLIQVVGRAWRRWQSDWSRLAYSLTHDANDAEDAVQEAVVRTLHAHGPELGSEEDVHEFVSRAIRTAVIDKIRRRRTRRRLLEELLGSGGTFSSTALEVLVRKGLRAPSSQQEATVKVALAQLTPDLREAIQLYCLTEPHLPFREIAAIQGVSTSTAHDRVQRALRILADALVDGSDE